MLMLNLTSACFALFSPIASLNNTVRAVKMFVIFFKIANSLMQHFSRPTVYHLLLCHLFS